LQKLPGYTPPRSATTTATGNPQSAPCNSSLITPGNHAAAGKKLAHGWREPEAIWINQSPPETQALPATFATASGWPPEKRRFCWGFLIYCGGVISPGSHRCGVGGVAFGFALALTVSELVGGFQTLAFEVPQSILWQQLLDTGLALLAEVSIWINIA